MEYRLSEEEALPPSCIKQIEAVTDTQMVFDPVPIY